MRRQILFIDDSAMLRRIAASALGAPPARYEVVSSTRASEGFARACAGETAVILVDERLAGSDDADLCRRLLDEPRTWRVPIILMTGRRADRSKLAALPENVVELLCKPFTPEQLVGTVNAIVALAAGQADFLEMRRALRAQAETLAGDPFTDQPLPPADAPAVAPNRETPCGRPGETSLRAALGQAAAEGRTGVLRIVPGAGLATEVFFESGHLVLVTTHDGAAYSRGAADFLPARVSPATLQDAAEEQGRTGMPFLLSLGARGLVSKAAGVDLLGRFGQRQIGRVLAAPARSLRITFEPLEALPGYTLRLEPIRESVDEWLLGALRLLTSDDLGPETRHQGVVGTPRLRRRGEASLQVLGLDPAENAFIQRVNGRHDLPTIARALELTPEAAFSLVHRFRCLDILDYHPAPLPFLLTPRTNMRRVLPLQR